jgi:protein phosphatase
MGTTLAVVLGLAEHVWIGHVGDARVYRLRDQMFECLTIDHNVGSDPRAGEWFGIAALARADPQALTRALGSREKIEPDVRREELRAGDVLLLATDGLTKMLDDAEIADVLLEHADACTAVARLIERANDRGGYDNITVIVGRCTTD